MIKKVVIVTSGQPSSNPRALKEATLFSENKISVTFIYCPITTWADEFDDVIIAENKQINFICTGYKTNHWKYKFIRLRKKYWELSSKVFNNLFDANLKSTVLFSQELKIETAKHKADLYIAHNIGAISAAVNAAKLYKAKVGFDAEDFHRGENSFNSNNIISKIEKKYFPVVNYCTVASPLIGKAYSNLFPLINFIVINNVFSLKYLSHEPIESNSDKLNLFWFSQFVGKNRGLETIIDAINIACNENIKLNLLGKITVEYKNELFQSIKNKQSINFLNNVHPNKIFEIAQKFDVGLATEIPHNLNRDICLTNKIFTYLLSGNAILFSGTNAQSDFLNENKGVGFLYKYQDSNSLAKLLVSLSEDKIKLNNLKKEAWKLARDKFNWELESQKLFQVINKYL